MKDFFNNIMQKLKALDKKYYIIAAAVLGVLVAAIILLVVFAGEGEQPSDESSITEGDKTTYTISIQNQSGLAIADIGVYVYEDNSQQELVWFAKTDAEGKITFTDATSDSYVAVLKDVPAGYDVEESYVLTGADTTIVLETAEISDDERQEITYKLGDIMHDFTLTTADGTEYKLSELLAKKKAVVLNFWYLECGPCKTEFPFLQEAYEKYSGDIEVLAMNPVNADADEVAKFQSDNGYTFPMALCGKEWESAMQLKAYPTTVVVDRFGVISLIHEGTIPDAATFEGIFGYFSAEEYEQGVIEDIETILPEEGGPVEGENPTELNGVSEFELTLQPGEEFFCDVYKIFGAVMTIKHEDVYVIYEDKTYNPSKGTVSVMITCPDPFTAARVGFGNKGDEPITITGTFAYPGGTRENPYSLKLGEVTTKISAGNDQGVYYTYKATESGTITLKFLSVSAGVECDAVLYNLNTYAHRSMAADGEQGKKTVSIKVNKRDSLQVIVGVLPDSTNNYPAATVKSLVSFEKGNGTNTEEEKKNVVYSVTVTDEDGKPMSGVKLTIDSKQVVTNASGVASVELVEGTYTAKLTVPTGYIASRLQYELTASKPSVSIKLQKDITIDDGPGEVDPTAKTYSVTVVDVSGKAQTGVTVNFLKNGKQVASQKVNSSGVATASLSSGTYTITLSGTSMKFDQSQAVLTSSKTSLKITVAKQGGSQTDTLYGEKTPIIDFGTTYVELKAGETNYFLFQPTEDGVYRFTSLNANAQVGFWGNNPSFITNQTGNTDLANNSFTITVKTGNLGGTYILSIDAASNVTGCIVKFVREGDVAYTDEEKAEWIDYDGKDTPKALNLGGKKNWTFFDVSGATSDYKLVKGSDGYYHLNSATGPKVFVKLGGSGVPYDMSISNMNTLSLMSKVFYENGKFVKKERYNACLNEYTACMDTTNGVYYLTDELMHILKNLGDAKGWWDSSSPNYLFDDVSKLNTEIAWMYLLCYYE